MRTFNALNSADPCVDGRACERAQITRICAHYGRRRHASRPRRTADIFPDNCRSSTIRQRVPDRADSIIIHDRRATAMLAHAAVRARPMSSSSRRAMRALPVIAKRYRPRVRVSWRG